MFGGIQKRKSRCPIGIDVGGHSITMMQLQRAAEGYRTVDAIHQTLPQGLTITQEDYHPTIAQTILKMLNQSSFVGREVVSCLPTAALHYKNLRLPKMPADELAAAVSWEASERLPFGSEAVITQHFDAGEVQQGDETRQEVILMASPQSFIESHVQVLTRCNLEPIALEVAPVALARCLSRCDEASPINIILDVGGSCSQILILKHGRVVFFKTIELGGNRFDQAIADKLKVTAEEATQLRHQHSGDVSDSDNVGRAVLEALRPVMDDLAREVGLCLRYYGVTFRGQRPDQAMLVGEEAVGSWFGPQFNEGAGINMIVTDPLENVDQTSSAHPTPQTICSGTWTVAAGLSMYGSSADAARKAVAA